MVHVIQSARIAKARMGKCHYALPKPVQTRSTNGRWTNKIRRKKIKPRKYRKVDITQSTESSQKQITLFEKREPSSRKELHKIELLKDDSNELLKRHFVHMQPTSPTGHAVKRIKETRAFNFIEDGHPWTEEEMRNFEDLYEEIVFDNTINLGPTSQADITFCETRKFHSYKNQPNIKHYSRTSPEFKEKYQHAKKMIQTRSGMSISESQIQRLMTLCVDEECFLRILDKEKRFLWSLFEQNICASKRRLLK